MSIFEKTCEICEDDFALWYCKTCKINICLSCLDIGKCPECKNFATMKELKIPDFVCISDYLDDEDLIYQKE